MRFSSTILPADARRSKNLELLIALLYLKGISTGDFAEELIMLLGKTPVGPSATVRRNTDAGARASNRGVSTRLVGYPLALGRLMLAQMTAAAGIHDESHVQSRSGTRPKLPRCRAPDVSLNHRRMSESRQDFGWRHRSLGGFRRSELRQRPLAVPGHVLLPCRTC